MAETRRKHPAILFIVLLCLGFLGSCLPNLLHLSQGGGFFTAVWILSFLLLTERFRSGTDTVIICGVFLAGYLLKFHGATSFEFSYVSVFLAMGLIQFGIFFFYSFLKRKWNSFICTLAFPIIWMAVYLLAIAVRFPSLIRVDMMFADMNVLLQAESLLGSFGLSFLLLWIFSLLAHAVGSRKYGPAMVGAALYFALLLIGEIYLYPNVTGGESVRVALSTGPYVGDYLNFTALPAERYLEGMRSCVSQAAEQGAEIIVFNEETYEFDDVEEEVFLGECCRAARENRIHVLVGLDLKDTDGSEDGRSVNKAVWIDRDGEILGSYVKTMIIPILETDYVRGSGDIPSHVISVEGKQLKVSYLICYDSNFPLYVRKIEDDTDILFLPSWDWAAITTQHAALCRTIAVANRVSVIKPTYDGINIAVNPDGTIIDSFNVNDIGYEQIRIIDVPVNGTKGITLEAKEKDHYIYSIIGVEIMSILVGLALLYGNHFESGERTRRNLLYSGAIVACLIGLGADAVSWIFDGCERLESVLYVSTVISLMMIFVLDSVFVYYITEYIHEKEPVSFAIPRIVAGVSAVAVILIVAFSGSDLLFTFDHGVYRDGPLYDGYVIASLLCSCICLWMNVIRMRSLSAHDRIASMSYIIFPCLAGCINLFVETFSYAYPASMLSLLVLYVMIQSERQNKLEEEGVISHYHARHDVLTGFANRLAYEERLKELACTDGMAGAVFTDVNGLKITNDNYGHEAGDSLLIRYAEIMCGCFRKEDVFRISGDEFTILLEKIDEEGFRARVDGFRKALNTDGVPQASVGQAYGSGKDIDKLVKTAEMEMYTDKTEFYKNHPEMKKR